MTTDIANETDENVLFDLWRNASEEDKPTLLPYLVRLLQRHAHAVCWQKLAEHRPDIVNDAIWRALDRQETFRGDAKFSSWFHAIVTNICLRAYKQRKRRFEVALEQINEPGTTGSEDARVDVERLFRELKPREQEIMRFKLQGLTDGEIADRLQTTVDTIKNTIRRVKEKMRRTIYGATNKRVLDRV